MQQMQILSSLWSLCPGFFLQAPRSGAASDTFADYAAFAFNVVSVSLAP